jgi:hypothetical protein
MDMCAARALTSPLGSSLTTCLPPALSVWKQDRDRNTVDSAWTWFETVMKDVATMCGPLGPSPDEVAAYRDWAKTQGPPVKDDVKGCFVYVRLTPSLLCCAHQPPDSDRRCDDTL